METEKKTILEKIGGWFKKHEAQPYVKVRNLADPFGERTNDPDDMDAPCDGRFGVEAGIKITF